MSPAAEGFLDEFITWRELGYNMAWQRPDYAHFNSLPDWARQTLEEHEDDPRDHLYTLAEFERGATHDPLWNAAQTQLVREGASTTTCGCSGARRSCSGPRRRARPWR